MLSLELKRGQSLWLKTGAGEIIEIRGNDGRSSNKDRIAINAPKSVRIERHREMLDVERLSKGGRSQKHVDELTVVEHECKSSRPDVRNGLG
jgi:sRNA-binding carbon storage regulator CsrA